MRREDIAYCLKKFFSPNNIHNRNGTSKDVEPISYWDKLLALSADYPESKSLHVEFRHIELFNRDLAEELLNNPRLWLETATEVISEMDFPVNSLPDITVRVIGIPEYREVAISKLRSDHLEKFVSIRCVVSRASEVRPICGKAAFECLRCGYITEVFQSRDSDLLETPFDGCENDTCRKKGPYKLQNEQSIFYDHQILKIQEPLESLRGRQPEFLYISCAGELAGLRKPGDKVIITGILHGKNKVIKEEKTKLLDFILVANSIQLSGKDFETIEISPIEEEKIKEYSKKENIKKMIVASVAPSIYGHEDIKEGIALQLFGGNRHDLPDGTSQRGDIHILLIGDPGTAKSQLLRSIAKLAPRAIQVSGGSTSGPGLTGAAVRDELDGKWTIEAGAITLAGEEGICCVDEMDKMSKSVRDSLHEALEQQLIHIAKAGVCAELPAGCALLGAANPKYGKFDPYENIAEQFNLENTLLTRMDLIFVLKDEPDPEKDEALALHILGSDHTTSGTVEVLDPEFMRKYIAYAKKNCHPEMTTEAKNVLTRFYTETRKTSGPIKDTVPITARNLEALRRLAEANAKIRLSGYVEKKDAEEAVRLSLGNLREVGVDPNTGKLDASIIDSGFSRSQRKDIKTLRGIIDNLCKKNITSNAAQIEDIERECEVQNIHDPINLLQKMKSKGDIIAITASSFRNV